MSDIAQDAARMLEMLPEQEQRLAFEMLKRIVKAWDPDFTRLSPEEEARVMAAEAEIANGETISHAELLKMLGEN